MLLHQIYKMELAQRAFCLNYKIWKHLLLYPLEVKRWRKLVFKTYVNYVVLITIATMLDNYCFYEHYWQILSVQKSVRCISKLDQETENTTFKIILKHIYLFIYFSKIWLQLIQTILIEKTLLINCGFIFQYYYLNLNK